MKDSYNFETYFSVTIDFNCIEVIQSVNEDYFVRRTLQKRTYFDRKYCGTDQELGGYAPHAGATET